MFPKRLSKYLILVAIMSQVIFVSGGQNLWAEDEESEDAEFSEEAEEGEDVTVANIQATAASQDDQFADYESEYGDELLAVPYSMRYAYSKKNGTAWDKTTYLQRGMFIREWKTAEDLQRIAEENRTRIELVAEEKKARDHMLEKQQEELKEIKRKNEKEREAIETERKKIEFENKIQKQKMTLDRLRIEGERKRIPGSR